MVIIAIAIAIIVSIFIVSIFIVIIIIMVTVTVIVVTFIIVQRRQKHPIITIMVNTITDTAVSLIINSIDISRESAPSASPPIPPSQALETNPYFTSTHSLLLILNITLTFTLAFTLFLIHLPSSSA